MASYYKAPGTYFRGLAIIALFKRDLQNIFKFIYNKSNSINPIEFDFGWMECTLTG